MIAMKMAIPQWFRLITRGAGPTRFLSCNSLVLRTPVAIRRFGSSRTGPEAEGNVARASRRAASTVVSTSPLNELNTHNADLSHAHTHADKPQHESLSRVRHSPLRPALVRAGRRVVYFLADRRIEQGITLLAAHIRRGAHAHRRLHRRRFQTQ